MVTFSSDLSLSKPSKNKFDIPVLTAKYLVLFHIYLLLDDALHKFGYTKTGLLKKLLVIPITVFTL